MERQKAFCSWSGGKESALAFDKALRFGIKISYLVNMTYEDGKRSCSHGVISKLIKLQGEAMGISILQRKTSWESYEEEFKETIFDLKRKGIQAGVFGDIDLEEHRDWVERVCKETEIQPILPLWGMERRKLLLEFIEKGFQAIVVAIHLDFLDPTWLGRKVDEKFLSDLEEVKGIDLCGEHGEYHTFVYDGPIFRRPVRFIIGKQSFNGKYGFLELNHFDFSGSVWGEI